MRNGAKVLKKMDIVATPQRLAVWRYVCDCEVHPSADDVYKGVKVAFPTISIATVYTILDTFVKAGLVKELYIRKNKVCYDNVLERHKHFLCIKCDKIYDINIKCRIEENGMVEKHKLENCYLYGICEKCLREGKYVEGKSRENNK